MDVGSKFVGGASNDTYEAYDASNGVGIVNTLGSADSIDGGAGTDTLALISADAVSIAATTVAKNIETLQVTSQGAVSLTPGATNFNALTLIDVKGATTAAVTAAATTDVNVAGATGASVAVDGGNNVTVNSAAKAQTITIGATTVQAGNASVTASAAGNIAIDGGKNVTVTATKSGLGSISIGQGGAVDGSDLASGVVTVSTTGAAYSKDSTGVTLGAIKVSGGSSVTVVQSATSSTAAAATDTTNVAKGVLQGSVTITTNGAAASVSVTQDKDVTGKDAVAAVAGVKQIDTVTFVDLAAGETTTVGGLKFTASTALKAEQVATAFANLAVGATVGSAPVSLGEYSGTFGNYSTGAVTTTKATGSTVDATAKTAAAAAAAITVADTAAGTVVSAVSNAPNAATTAVTGVMEVISGAVTITDAGKVDALSAVTLAGSGAAQISSDALSTLTLSNSNNAVQVVNALSKSLTLNLSGIGTSKATPAVDIGSTYTTLTVDTGAVAGSDINLNGGALTSLTVSGSKTLDLNGSTLGALKSVTVTGAAGLTAENLNTVTSFDTTASTGSSTLRIDATAATYKGGAGVDDVTAVGAVSKGVSLGGGDDFLTLAASSATAAIEGGDGVDTLALSAANAETASVNSLLAAKVSGFEVLYLGAAAASATVDLANLDAISYVVSEGTDPTFTLNIDNMANGGTIELVGAAATVDVDLVDAKGTSDTLNAILDVDVANIDFGTLNIAGVETLALSAIDADTSLTTGGGVNKATIAIADAALKSLTVSGSANVVLSADSVVLATIDGSSLTGSLTASTNGTTAATLTGGSGADALTSSGDNDVLVGGAGADTLVVGAASDLATLTGGAGSDVFDVSLETNNSNSYATVTDFTAGDKILFAAAGAGSVSFVATKVSLAATASFGDYANAAAVAAGADDVAWFQFGGDTYIVQDQAADSASFVNGEDMIVKLTGTIDLSTLAFSSSALTLG